MSRIILIRPPKRGPVAERRAERIDDIRNGACGEECFVPIRWHWGATLGGPNDRDEAVVGIFDI